MAFQFDAFQEDAFQVEVVVSVSVVVTPTITYTRTISKTFSLNTSPTLSYQRTISKTFTVNISPAVSFTKALTRFLKQQLSYLFNFVRITAPGPRVLITATGPDELQFKRGTVIKFHAEFTDKDGTLYDPDTGTVEIQIRKPDGTVYTGWNFSDNKTLTKISTGIYEIDFQTSTSDTVGVYKAEVAGVSGANTSMDDLQFMVKA